MKKLAIILSVFLIAGHLLTETGSLLYILNDKQSIYIDPFLSSSYHYPDPKGIDMFWFYKYLFDDFLLCLIFFVLAKVAYQYSYRLFRIACVFFAYHLLDSFMLWYNFKTSYWLYAIVYVAIIISIILIFIPEPKKAKIKSLH